MNQSLFHSIKSAALIVAVLLGLLNISQANAWEGDLSGNQYGASEARRYQRIQLGVVEDIRQVVVTRESESAGYIGAAMGAVLGGVLGNTVGNGRGRMVASTIGGMLGGVAGKMAGEQTGREIKRSAEIIVTMKSGEVISVVQELDGETAQLQPGDRVRLIEGQAIRVVKMRTTAL